MNETEAQALAAWNKLDLWGSLSTEATEPEEQARQRAVLAYVLRMLSRNRIPRAHVVLGVLAGAGRTSSPSSPMTTRPRLRLTTTRRSEPHPSRGPSGSRDHWSPGSFPGD